MGSVRPDMFFGVRSEKGEASKGRGVVNLGKKGAEVRRGFDGGEIQDSKLKQKGKS